MDLQNYYINENDTIIAAIDVIEKNKNKNVFTVNDDNKIVGVISQGDIIRGILDGVELHSLCNQIHNTNFVYLSEKDCEKAYKMFKKGITLVPVISKDFKLVDVITRNDIYVYLENK